MFKGSFALLKSFIYEFGRLRHIVPNFTDFFPSIKSGLVNYTRIADGSTTIVLEYYYSKRRSSYEGNEKLRNLSFNNEILMNEIMRY